MISPQLASNPAAHQHPVAVAQKSGPGEVRNGLLDEQMDGKVEQTIAYMMQHLDEPLPVSRLAALANVSCSHYFAVFKRRTGYAPIEFFIRLRMYHACRLLDGTSLSVKGVAAALGYDDPFYFSRVFKSVNRIAPSEYRMMAREFRDTVCGAALPLARCAQRTSIANTERHAFDNGTRAEHDPALTLLRTGSCRPSFQTTL